MELLFEKSRKGRRCDLLPPLDVPPAHLMAGMERETPLDLPELSEVDLTRHYSALERRAHGVNNGFYPLGSCTMKYNPRINEELAAMPGFTGVHPTQSADTAQGCLEVLYLAEELLCEIIGMDAMTFQPAAGAHGEFTALLMVKKYHLDRGDTARTKILVPDSAHGTNPASAAMCGFTVVNVPSNPAGGVDLEALKAAVGLEIDHIFQAIYYALIKYGTPKEVIIKNTNFHSYINSVGKLKKADINFSIFRINGAMASIGINTKFILPKILNIKSIATDLKNLKKPKADINLFELKNVLDGYIENSINKKHFRSKAE